MEPGGCCEQGDACGVSPNPFSGVWVMPAFLMLADIKKIFNRTKQIEGVHTVNIYENVTPRPNRHDLMIEMEMDPEALSVYDASADHQEWKAKYGKYIQTKTIFDYE